MKQELAELMASLGITPERFEEIHRRSESDPETIKLMERSARFENGAETAEDLAWLEEGKNNGQATWAWSSTTRVRCIPCMRI